MERKREAKGANAVCRVRSKRLSFFGHFPFFMTYATQQIFGWQTAFERNRTELSRSARCDATPRHVVNCERLGCLCGDGGIVVAAPKIRGGHGAIFRFRMRDVLEFSDGRSRLRCSPHTSAVGVGRSLFQRDSCWIVEMYEPQNLDFYCLYSKLLNFSLNQTP
jgi:hypothetical protein